MNSHKLELTFHRKYKSIKQLPIAELPDFSVITGANGAGKTHFLEAIRNSDITTKDINASLISYYNWSSLLVAENVNANADNSKDEKNRTIDYVSRLSSAYAEDALYQLHRNASYKNIVVNLDEQKLSDVFYDNTGVYSEEDALIKSFLNEVNDNVDYCIEQAIQGNSPNIALYTSSGQITSRLMHGESASALKYILEKSKKPFFALTREDCDINYPLVLNTQDPFIGSLKELFINYIYVRYDNAANMALSTQFNAQTHYLSNDDFLKQYGQPPWEVFNNVLESAGILFRFKEPNANPSIPLQLHLYHTSSNAEVSFSSLSSGERVLISIAHFLFYAQDNRQPTAMPSLILLDEVDAPLHPSMTIDLLRTIKDVIIGKYNRKVILTTHSPSTVALAPEDAIHVMDVETKIIRKVSRDEGIQALTVGIPILSIKIENRRQVFVESDYDINYYERIVVLLKKHLRVDISFVFISSGTKGSGSCDRVKALVKELSDAGSHIVFGIIDWDLHAGGNEKVRVLGKGKRYSIENYLFDPIVVAILLFQMKIIGRDALCLDEEQTYADLRTFSNENLQIVVNNTLRFLGFELDLNDKSRDCSYVNGHVVKIPVAYLEMRGHDLEARIKRKSDKFQKFRSESSLKIEILENVLYNMPGFLSVDFVELLRGIQDS